MASQTAAHSTSDFPGKEQAARRLALLDIDPKTSDASVRSDLTRQLKDNPRDPIALDRLGAIQERDGAFNEAADTYQSALNYNPQDSGLTLKLAELYSSAHLNDPQKALALAKTAHDLAPDDPRVSALLGRLVYQSGGDCKWAESLLEDSARKLPGNPQVAYDLAWAYYSLGRIPEAEAQMRESGHDHGRTGWMIIFGDAFHNFTDGVIIAGAFLADVKIGLVTSLAIIAHEIPQEIGDFVVLLHSGFTKRSALFWNLVSGMSSVAGGVIAYFALSRITDLIPDILAFAVASMIYVAVADLIPGLHKTTAAKDSLYQVVFIALGIASIWLIHGVLFPEV